MSLSTQRHAHDPDRAPDDPEAALEAYLRQELAATDPPLHIKAKTIADALGLHSSHVGGLLGTWQTSADAPVTVSVWGGASHSRLWVIEP